MFQAPRKKRTITVIAPSDAAILEMLDAFSAHPDVASVAHFKTLGEAYSVTEAEPPNAVICTKSVADTPEFFMFNALVKMLGLRLVILGASDGATAAFQALGLSKPSQSGGAAPPVADATSRAQRLVVIGASTGGIEALSNVLSGFPALCPPTVIVQHIKADFLGGVVSRLDAVCAAQVREASDGEPLVPGRILIAPGNLKHLVVTHRGKRCELRDGPAVSGHRPSVDRLFESASALGPAAVGVLLTGMGRDGATGLGTMRRSGAWTIAQDAQSSTVYGMPRVARDEGAVCETVSLSRMATAILQAARPMEVAR